MAEAIEGETEWTSNGRVYRASGGNRRNPMLHLIPHPSNPVVVEGGRAKQFSDIRDVKYRYDGRGFRLELSDVLIVVTGRNLIPVACAIMAHTCSFIEAFNPEWRDMPTEDSQSFIETIAYFLPPGMERPATSQLEGAAKNLPTN